MYFHFPSHQIAKFVGIVVLLCLPISVTAVQTQIQIVTEDLPPYQFLDENNQLSGLSIDIVQAMLAQAKVDVAIEVMPWARAYDMALKQKNVMIFSINRSKDRQDKFKWVGDFLKQNYYFLTLKSRTDIKVDNIQEVKGFVTGVARDSVEHEVLIKYGFSSPKNLHINVAQVPLIEMLFKGHIDMIFGSKITLLAMVKYLKRDVADIELLYQLNETPANISIAMSKSTDDKTVRHFQNALRVIKKNGTFDKIMTKWLKP